MGVSSLLLQLFEFPLSQLKNYQKVFAEIMLNVLNLLLVLVQCSLIASNVLLDVVETLVDVLAGGVVIVHPFF